MHLAVIAASLIALELVVEGVFVGAARSAAFKSAAFQENGEVLKLKAMHDTHEDLQGVKWDESG
jgi:SpoU rRNA methylase family enzyme